MDTLALKILVTPLLIAVASVVGRRWGHTISGWLIALPYTAGPVVFFLALDHGAASAGVAAAGVLTGVMSEAGWALAYGWIACYAGWPVAVLAGATEFALGTVTLRSLSLPLGVLFIAVAIVLALTLVLLPRLDVSRPSEAPAPPSWDIPLRMVVATVVVLTITSIAPTLGSYTSGMLATFPAFATILTVFAHAHGGGDSAIRVLRGLLMGLYAFASFFLVLASVLGDHGIVVGFALAAVAACAVQSTTLWLLHRVWRERVVPSSSSID